MKLLKVIITLYFGPESHQRIIHTRGSTKKLFPFETSDFHSSSVCRIFPSSMSSINTPTPIIVTEPVLCVRHVAHPGDHIDQSTILTSGISITKVIHDILHFILKVFLMSIRISHDHYCQLAMSPTR